MIQVITSYYNPAAYKSKKENFLRFDANIKSHGLPLTVVEWSHNGRFELDDGETHASVLRVSSPDVMWQKERLLNIALATLPSDCEAVVWADNDILFAAGGQKLTEKISGGLSRYPVIQPFERVLRLPKGISEFMGGTPVHYSYGYKRARYGNEITPENEEVSGNVGYAWAARTDFLRQLGGLYDAAILDGGDRLMAHAFAGCPNEKFLTERLNCFQYDHFKKWAAAAACEVGFCPGIILHQWHGSIAKRQYTNRHLAFRHFGFHPGRDIKMGATGAWVWRTPKKEMHRMVKSYFNWRAEDE